MKKQQISLKRLKRSAIAAVMTVAMAVPFVPGYAAAAGQVQEEETVPVTKSVTKEAEYAVSKGDVDRDGLIGLDDAQLILKAALNLITIISEQKEAGDVNENGKIDLGDAQLVLRHVLDQKTLEGIVTLPIKEMSDIPTPQAVWKYIGDKKYTYTIAVDNADMCRFDYGVCYDKDVFELVPFDEEENGKWGDFKRGIAFVLDLEGKAAVGGVYRQDYNNYSGDVVTLTFREKDGAAGTTEITLVPNSAHADEEALANGLKTQVNLDEFHLGKGDLNGDGLIGLDDAQLICRIALNLMKSLIPQLCWGE